MAPSNPPRYRPPLTRTRRPAIGQSKSARHGTCPYLGTAADPGTSLSFASDANHCYRTRLPVPISGIHQESYCITSEYQQCPVYQQQLQLEDVAVASIPVMFYDEPLQPEQAAALTPIAPPPAPARRPNLRSIMVAALLLVVLLGAWWLWRSFLSQPDPDLALNTLQPQETVAIVERASGVVDQPPAGVSDPAAVAESGAGSAVGEAVATATPAPPTPTAPPAEDSRSIISIPELPPTATPSVIADSQLCEQSPAWWTPFVVRSGDTLVSLAETVGLEADEIMEANCLETMVIVPGLVINLPPLGIVVEITATVELTPTATREATARVTPTGSGPVAVVPSPTAIAPPPSATPVPLVPEDDAATGTPPERPTQVPTATVPPTATAPVSIITPTPSGPTATPPTLPSPGTATATPPVFPGSGSPTATPPALP